SPGASLLPANARSSYSPLLGLKHLHPLPVHLADKQRPFRIHRHEVRQEQRLWIAPTRDNAAVGQVEVKNLVDVAFAGQQLVADDEQAERIAEAAPVGQMLSG